MKRFKKWLYNTYCNLMFHPDPKTISKLRSFIWKVIGFCPIHGGIFNYSKRYRMNTAYLKEELNYSYGCGECQQESFEYYQERWDEYNSGRL